MIIILKIILGLLAIADILIGRFVTLDFIKARKTESFDDLSLWEKLRYNSVFFFLAVSLIALLIFLIYFIVIPLNIVNA